MIIGVCGFIGAGKDTVADYLVNWHEFKRQSFASSLKDAVSAVFGWDRDLLEGRTKESREWREQVDAWWSVRLSMPHLTPRWILQYWGTEVCRGAFHDDIWIASVENKLRQSKDDIVISDCRFPNEVLAIKRAGGKVVWVKRGPTPVWYDCAMLTLKTPYDDLWFLQDQGESMCTKYHTVHASEWSWVATDFDQVINNDGTVEQLYEQIKNLRQ